MVLLYLTSSDLKASLSSKNQDRSKINWNENKHVKKNLYNYHKELPWTNKLSIIQL